MLRRSNKREDKPDKSIEKSSAPEKNPAANTEHEAQTVAQNVPETEKPAQGSTGRRFEDTMSREELIMHNEDARKVYEDIMKLRQSVENLKQPDSGDASQVQDKSQIRKTAGAAAGMKNSREVSEEMYLKETEEIIAAKQAILEQAKKDAASERIKREKLMRKEQEAALQQQKVLEAQKRAALVKEEAERKRREALEAEKKAKEASRKAALEAMEAERRKQEEQKEKAETPETAAAKATASPEEMAEFFGEEKKPETGNEQELEKAKQALLLAQKQQEVKLDRISQVTEHHTSRLAEVQQEKLAQQQEMIKAEHEEVTAVLDDQKEQRVERLVQDEKNRRLKEEKRAKAQAEKAAKEARALAEKEAKKIKEQRKKEDKLRKAEEKKLAKKARTDAAAAAQLEQMKLEDKLRAEAELGGGVVNVQGVSINTEIQEVAHVSLRDFFGIRTRKERKADSEKERRKLEKERQKRAEEARKIVDWSMQKRALKYRTTKFARKFNRFKKFCDRHKAALLTAFAILLMALIGTAGVFNYYSAYAYSYNGKTLGVVKDKDDVLKITDLVQGALTEDKNVDVIIDARNDIEFERIYTTGDTVEIDTSEDVLKRLTYMGDINVKAYCIFIEGKKIGAVEDKKTAENVFRDIEEKYTSDMEGAEVEQIEILEQWETKEANISLDKVYSEDEMVNLLCTSGEKESHHTVVAGETLADIAKTYSLTEDEILDDNPDVDRKKLVVGSKLVIKQEAPILTVRITEKATYDKVIKFETVKKEDEDIYEGYTELKQKGKDGLSEVTSRIVYVNGEQIEETPLVTTVKEEPVDKIVLVGVKERPPSVGSGKYIWPVESGVYTITSRFGPRWGSFHSGVDLGMSTGNKVFAADGGVVTSAGYSGGYGYLVTIDHQNGMETRYAHNSQLLVSVGDKVFQGQEIARSGNSGHSTGPHLHFEVRVNGTAKNPLDYLP